MEWLNKPGRIRPYYERDPEEGKEIWVFFSHETHVPFFKDLGDAFLQKYEVEIVVFWSLSQSMISIPPEEILMRRSDLFFVDTSLLLQDNGFMIRRLASTLSRHRGGYLIFAPNEDELTEVDRILKRKEKDEEGYHDQSCEPLSTEREKVFFFPKNPDKSLLDTIFRKIDEATIANDTDK